MKYLYYAFFVTVSVCSSFPAWGMEEPSSRIASDRVRAGTALVMAWSGLNYLRVLYWQQMNPPLQPTRGWRNPAFRFLSTFFGAAIVQQANSNVVTNPEVQRLFRRATDRMSLHTSQDDRTDGDDELNQENSQAKEH